MMRVVEEDVLADLTSRAEELGFEIFCDQTWGYVLRRIGRENADLDDHARKLTASNGAVNMGRPIREPRAGRGSR